MASPHEGKRIKRANGDEIYLVLDGQLRHIPSWEAYTRLFANNNWEEWTQQQFDTNGVPLGPPFGENLAMVAGTRAQGAKVFLRDGNTLRWIRNPSAMRKYDFVFDRVLWGSGSFTANGPDVTE